MREHAVELSPDPLRCPSFIVNNFVAICCTVSLYSSVHKYFRSKDAKSPLEDAIIILLSAAELLSPHPKLRSNHKQPCNGARHLVLDYHPLNNMEPPSRRTCVQIKAATNRALAACGKAKNTPGSVTVSHCPTTPYIIGGKPRQLQGSQFERR
jgi:hypothetical protein